MARPLRIERADAWCYRTGRDLGRPSIFLEVRDRRRWCTRHRRPLSPLLMLLGLLLTFSLINDGTAQVSPNVRVVTWGDNSYFQTNTPPGLTNVVAVASGSGHHLALNQDGTVVAWGLNNSGQTNVPAGLSNVIALAAGNFASAALRADGTVVAWGSSGVRNVPPGLSGVVGIAGGDSHMLALKWDGTVTGWGSTAYGETNPPPDLSHVVAIAGGSSFSVAVKDDGAVVAWGLNNFGQTNVPATASNVVAVTGGYRSAWALRKDGTGFGWGDGSAAALFGGGFIALAANVFYNGVYELLSDGTIRNGGDNPNFGGIVALPSGSYGNGGVGLAGPVGPFMKVQPVQQSAFAGAFIQFRALPFGLLPLTHQWQHNGTNVPGATNSVLYFPALQLGDAGTYRVIANGFVTSSTATLNVIQGPPYILLPPSNQVSLIGQSPKFQVTADGAQPFHYQWRFGDVDIPGATNAVLTLDKVTLSQAGNYSVTVGNSYGTVTSPNARLFVQQIFSWGGIPSLSNYPPDLGSVLAIASTFASAHDLALRGDRTVAAWGDPLNGLTTVPPGLANVVAIAAGSVHNLVLKGDGTMASWGISGNNDVTNVPSGLGPVRAIGAGSGHSLALAEDGTVIAWGNDTYGQADVPPNLTNIAAIAAGGWHSLALKSDGTVRAWGQYYYGQTDVPAGLTNVVAIAAGTFTSLALKADGGVVAWGQNGNTGQTNLPAALSNVVALAAGNSHCVALRNNGSVVAWGSGGASTTNVPSIVSNVTAIAAGESHTLVLMSAGVPGFTVHPFDQVAFATTPVVLHARAAGALPLSFQWQVNGTDIPGATNASLLLPHVQLSDTGNYRALVSNSAGSDTSKAAKLTVLESLRIAVQPQAQSVLVGEDVTLTVGASGVPPLHYQWQFNGTDLVGATDPTLNLNSVETNQAGSYKVLVSSPAGQLSSDQVLLNVKYILAYAAGQALAASNTFVGPATVELRQAFPGGSIYYTLNGSKPSFLSRLYTGPFVVPANATLRAVAYSADFLQSSELEPAAIVIVPVYSLLAGTAGGGNVTVVPTGPYQKGEMASVTAAPGVGWTFLGWLGDANGTNLSMKISMERNKCVQAVFGTTVSTTVAGPGAVSLSPQVAYYPFGSVLRLTALPDAGNLFGAWGNAASGNVNPLTFTVTNPVPVVSSVFAQLSPRQYALTAQVTGAGRVTITPGGNHYNNGQTVTAMALPETGQSFVGWSGDIASTENPVSILMDQSKLINASFTRHPRTFLPPCLGTVSDEGFQLMVDCELGAVVVIEGSNDLLQWTPLANLSNSLGAVQFRDESSTNLSHRFYRAVLP